MSFLYTSVHPNVASYSSSFPSVINFTWDSLNTLRCIFLDELCGWAPLSNFKTLHQWAFRTVCLIYVMFYVTDQTHASFVFQSSEEMYFIVVVISFPNIKKHIFSKDKLFCSLKCWCVTMCQRVKLNNKTFLPLHLQRWFWFTADWIIFFLCFWVKHGLIL